VDDSAKLAPANGPSLAAVAIRRRREIMATSPGAYHIAAIEEKSKQKRTCHFSFVDGHLSSIEIRMAPDKK
jgi:hypothetical protein